MSNSEADLLQAPNLREAHQTPDWAQSEAYLRAHADELLSDEAEAALEMLRRANPEHPAIPQHQALLRRAREVGIEAAYRAVHE